MQQRTVLLATLCFLDNTADEPEIVNDSKTLKAYQHKNKEFL